MNLRGFAVKETVGQPQSDIDEKTELKRFFYSVIDAVHGEMDARFGERVNRIINNIGTVDL